MAYDKTFQARVWPVITTVFDEYVAPVFDGRLADGIPSSLTPLPIGVYQSQDLGGKNHDHIGHNGWTGLVTIRCLDTTKSGAWNKALEVTQALANVDHDDYSIDINAKKPTHLPIEKTSETNIYTAAIVFDIGIYPKNI